MGKKSRAVNFETSKLNTSLKYAEIPKQTPKCVSSNLDYFIVDSENKWTFQEIKIPHTPLQARFPNLATVQLITGFTIKN